MMAASQSPQAIDEVRPFITYPPFPQPPPGTAIIPFSQFQPVGIAVRVNAEAEEEMDGLGKRTVRLRVRHDLTPAERRKGLKKLKSGKAVVADSNGQTRRLLWHEEWALHEALDRHSCDPCVFLSVSLCCPGCCRRQCDVWHRQALFPRTGGGGSRPDMATRVVQRFVS